MYNVTMFPLLVKCTLDMNSLFRCTVFRATDMVTQYVKDLARYRL